jgi:diacylglycerol kinase (ATP)
MQQMEPKWFFIIREHSANSRRTSSRLQKIFGPSHAYCVSEYAGHSMLLAEEALTGSFQYVIAVGGDGTIHEVANGLMNGMKKTGLTAPPLALLPAGTGNDFARMFSINSTIQSLKHRLLRGKTEYIDVGECSFTNQFGQKETRHFINVMDMGLGGSIAARVTHYRRGFWAKLAYQRALLRELPFYKRVTVTCTMDGIVSHREILSIVIANGKWFGKGIGISPYSSISDGHLNGVIFGRVGIFEYLRHFFSLVRCKPVIHSEVSYHVIREISIDSAQALPIELDGEFLGYTPATIVVIPQAIRLVI